MRLKIQKTQTCEKIYFKYNMYNQTYVNNAIKNTMCTNKRVSKQTIKSKKNDVRMTLATQCVETTMCKPCY